MTNDRDILSYLFDLLSVVKDDVGCGSVDLGDWQFQCVQSRSVVEYTVVNGDRFGMLKKMYGFAFDAVGIDVIEEFLDWYGLLE